MAVVLDELGAFGCVLYEMLTGRRAFDGDDVSEALAAVLKAEPDWTALPAVTPEPIRRLLRRCLVKDPARRLSDIAVARLEIDDATEQYAIVAIAPATRLSHPGALARLTWGLAGAGIVLIALAPLALRHLREEAPPAAPTIRLPISPPPGMRIETGHAVSPDGRFVAFRASRRGENVRLWIRALDTLESMQKPRFMIGRIPPTPGLVDQFFNTSTGTGEEGEIDARGAWNQGEGLQMVVAPAFQELAEANGSGAVDDRTTSTAGDPEVIEELLVEQLRDLLNAEGQLVKAIPKMVKAARSDSLRLAFENHLEETKQQVERLKEVFSLVGVPAKGKPCKGMAGLIEEGEEVIEEGHEKEDAPADLALIAAAQKVEHYEISAYGTARTMAGQAGLPQAAELLNRSLAEEEIADNLMTQLARELMSEARVGLTKAPKRQRAEARAEKD